LKRRSTQLITGILLAGMLASNGITSPLVGGYEAYLKLYDNSNNAPSVNFTIK
jgi:hypothetical protein